MAFEIYEQGESGTVIKVVGVGGAGGNALNNMIERTIPGNVEFIAINTDRQALSQTKAEKTIQLGTTGLGAGARPEVGMQTAEQARDEIAEALRGANMVFITAGMGGGTGTGASPVIAEVSQELGILTVAVVTQPFSFEGNTRKKNALAGMAALKNRVHSMLVILNDKLEEELGEDATMMECFEKADEVLYNACSGIAEIIYSPGIINVDFNDVRTVMSQRGTALMGAAEAEGPDRAETAASKAIECPLLDGVQLPNAHGLLVNITASKNMKMSEIRVAMSTIKNFAHPDANIVMGAVYDDSMGDKMRVTVIATGLNQEGTDNTYVTSTEPEVDQSVSGIWSTAPSKPAAVASSAELFGNPVKPAVNKESSVWNVPQPRKAEEKPKQVTPPQPAPQPQPAPIPQPEKVVIPHPAAKPAEPPKPVETQKEPAAQTRTAPTFDIFNAPTTGRPISQPETDNPFASRANQGPSDPVFGNSKPKVSPQDIFATLGNRNSGSGLWTTEPQKATEAKHAEQKPEGEAPKSEEPDFDFRIPSFLRKNNG